MIKFSKEQLKQAWNLGPLDICIRFYYISSVNKMGL